jgi:hypothetical protein
MAAGVTRDALLVGGKSHSDTREYAMQLKCATIIEPILTRGFYLTLTKPAAQCSETAIEQRSPAQVGHARCDRRLHPFRQHSLTADHQHSKV